MASLWAAESGSTQSTWILYYAIWVRYNKWCDTTSGDKTSQWKKSRVRARPRHTAAGSARRILTLRSAGNIVDARSCSIGCGEGKKKREREEKRKRENKKRVFLFWLRCCNAQKQQYFLAPHLDNNFRQATALLGYENQPCRKNKHTHTGKFSRLVEWKEREVKTYARMKRERVAHIHIYTAESLKFNYFHRARIKCLACTQTALERLCRSRRARTRIKRRIMWNG